MNDVLVLVFVMFGIPYSACLHAINTTYIGVVLGKINNSWRKAPRADKRY
jgi:ABC-type Co2+ transport system permease subunit